MAKKTEQELKSILKNRGGNLVKGMFNKTPKRHIVTFDGAEKPDVTTVQVIDKKTDSVVDIINEIRKYNAPKIDEKTFIRTSMFNARFEDENLPQKEEIDSITFKPAENDDILYIDVRFKPKRKLYFELLTTNLDEEPFIIEFFDRNGEVVDAVKLYLSTAKSALSKPIEFDKSKGYADFVLNDELSYELRFEFTV